MRARRRLALFLFLAAIAAAMRASRTAQQQAASFLATVRRRVGADIAPTVAVVGRDEFTALEEKLNTLSQELDRDRQLAGYLAKQAARSVETTRESRAPVTDSLTGLLNRRALDEALADEIERAKRLDSDVGLVLIDLDNFKQVNDRYGHPQGDVVLREVARALHDSSRDVDHVARYGGAELAVILPGNDVDGACKRGDQIRELIAQLRIPRIAGEGTLRLTASCGAASARGAPADRNALIQAADQALYEDKHRRKRRRDDGPDGGVREPRRPNPDRGAGGVALHRPYPLQEPDDPKPPDTR